MLVSTFLMLNCWSCVDRFSSTLVFSATAIAIRSAGLDLCSSFGHS